ncbi:MAG: CPBP family intramembrane metalloprotease [Lachnospiraceae bacterium]|nr:CPBP family intramembrane metalloprotease [Lachnospiraceae bacterium]
MQYSVSVPVGIVLYGLISPVAEELVFRGLVMKRLQRYFSTGVAIVTSAFIFAMYHGNLVQGLYAFLLGMVIAVCYWHFDSLLIPILFHGAANISVFVITHDRQVEMMFNKPWNCVIYAIISFITYYELMKIKKTMGKFTKVKN